MAFIEFNDCPLHFEVKGRGPDLLFLHGLGADLRQSNDFLKKLNGYRIITIDMPGHGQSSLSSNLPLSDQVSFQIYAQAARLVLSFLEISSVIVGGISMGAAIAIQLALSNIVRVKALLIVRPAWLDHPARPQLAIIEKIGGWLESSGQNLAEKWLKNDQTYISIMNENPNCAASILGAIHRPQAVTAAGVFEVMVADQPIEKMSDLQKCEVPALVIGNDFDPLHPKAISQEIAIQLPESIYFHAPPKYLSPLGHIKATTSAVKTFLKQI